MLYFSHRPVGIVACLWSWIRGVREVHNWQQPCDRCGWTGMAHYGIIGPISCKRFKLGKNINRNH